MLEARPVRPVAAGRTSPGGAAIRLVAFGGLAIEPDDLPNGALAGQRKCLALLAILAVAGRRGVARDKLMALLGPDTDTEHARNALSQVIFRVRRALGPSFIEGKDELALNQRVATSDVGEFERAIAGHRLDEAVALYQGPFLDGFYVREALEFERWAADVRARLEREHLVALDKLASAASRRGDLAGAVAWHRRRFDADPLSALAARGLVEALVASGDRDGALRAGLGYAERIRVELDAEPDADFRDLLHALRAGRLPPGLLPVPSAIGAAQRARVVSFPNGGATSDLVMTATARRPVAQGLKSHVGAARRLGATLLAAAMLMGSAVLFGWQPAHAIERLARLLQATGGQVPLR